MALFISSHNRDAKMALIVIASSGAKHDSVAVTFALRSKLSVIKYAYPRTKPRAENLLNFYNFTWLSKVGVEYVEEPWCGP